MGNVYLLALDDTKNIAGTTLHCHNGSCRLLGAFWSIGKIFLKDLPTAVGGKIRISSGAPGLLRPPRPGPCLNFGLQLTLSQPGG